MVSCVERCACYIYLLPCDVFMYGPCDLVLLRVACERAVGDHHIILSSDVNRPVGNPPTPKHGTSPDVSA